MPNPPVIKKGSAFPCYRRSTDIVHMPERGFFKSEEAYVSTLYHEVAHSTGHESRLARKSLLHSKGIAAAEEGARKVYAEEELVAEMASAFLATHAGIAEGEIENSAAYIEGWLSALKAKDAKSWVIRAASQAQKAANYILNVSPEDETSRSQ